MLGVTIPDATLADFQAAGAQRVSIGGALTYAAAQPIIEFGTLMLDQGSFAWTSAGHGIEARPGATRKTRRGQRPLACAQVPGS